MLKAANVSTVPHRSPLRYPGGKTWLIPQVRKWLADRGGSGVRLVEPFAGGAIVALTAVMEKLVSDAVILELDSDVAAVWSVALGRYGPSLAEQIRSFDFTEKNVLAVLDSRPANVRERAFKTILKNRVTRNGILASGVGVLRSGESGHGLRSRWYPETLATRLMAIHEHRSAIAFKERDGIRYLKKCVTRRDHVYFIDPPYDGVGRRLYRHFSVDHAELFEIVASLEGDFLMTYNSTAEIQGFADRHGFETVPVRMNGGSGSDKVELLIGRDLRWVCNQSCVDSRTEKSSVHTLCAVG